MRRGARRRRHSIEKERKAQLTDRRDEHVSGKPLPWSRRCGCGSSGTRMDLAAAVAASPLLDAGADADMYRNVLIAHSFNRVTIENDHEVARIRCGTGSVRWTR